MNRCQIQRGVFALRPCPNAALMVCQSCNRPACGDHTAQPSPPLCSECAARQAEQEAQRQAASGKPRHRRWEDDEHLSYSYRSWLWNDSMRHHHDDDDEDETVFGDADDFHDAGGDDDSGFGDS